MKKFLIAAVSLIIIVAIALTLFIKIYLTPEKVKEYIIPVAEDSLNRKVSIGKMDINILEGIALNDFTIKEADQETDFVKCKDFILKFQLLPLLSGNVVIDEIKIVAPTVRIERDKKGRYNFNDIGKKDLPEEAAADSGDNGDEDNEELPISLLVNKISISDAKLSLTDLKGELPDIKSTADAVISIQSLSGSELLTEGVISINVEEADFRGPSSKRIRNMASELDYALRADLKSGVVSIEKANIKLQQISVSVKGLLKQYKTSPEIELSVHMPKVESEDIRDLAALFTDLKGINLSGAVSADAKLKGKIKNLDALSVAGTVALDKVGFEYEEIKTNLDGELKFVLESDNLYIDRAELEIGGIPVSLKGEIRKVQTSSDLDIALSLQKEKIEKLQAVLAQFVRVEGLTLSGHIAAELKVKGRLKKPETMSAEGDVSLDNLRVKYDNVDAVLDGKVKLDKKTMHVDVKGVSGRNAASLKGSISNLFKNQDINLNVYSKKLYLDELVPSTKKESQKKPVANNPVSHEPAGEKSSPEKEAEPMKLKLTAKGEVKVESAVYNGLNMSGFHMTYVFKDNKLNVSKMSAKAGKGEFELSSLVDFSKTGYTYDLKTKIDSMHAEELVNAFFPKAKNKVFGIITSNLKLRGKGTLPENLKKNLVGDADFNISNGRITDAEIARELSTFIDLGELETIEFSKAEGTVNIRNSIAKLDSIFESDELQMDPKGNIGLDESIDLAFDLKLSPDLTDKVRASVIRKNIRDEGGWGIIPLFVNGTFSDPQYGVDVAKVGKKVINKEINKFMDKLLKKEDSGEQQLQKEGVQTQEPENPLEDLLKQLPGLFQ